MPHYTPKNSSWILAHTLTQICACVWNMNKKLWTARTCRWSNLHRTQQHETDKQWDRRTAINRHTLYSEKEINMQCYNRNELYCLQFITDAFRISDQRRFTQHIYIRFSSQPACADDNPLGDSWSHITAQRRRTRRMWTSFCAARTPARLQIYMRYSVFPEFYSHVYGELSNGEAG